MYNLEDYLTFESGGGLFDLMSGEFFVGLRSLGYVEVEIGGRALDKLCYDVYGDERLWWVVCLFNDIVDPMDLGRLVLLIPNLDEVEDYLLRWKNKR